MRKVLLGEAELSRVWQLVAPSTAPLARALSPPARLGEWRWVGAHPTSTHGRGRQVTAKASFALPGPGGGAVGAGPC